MLQHPQILDVLISSNKFRTFPGIRFKEAGCIHMTFKFSKETAQPKYIIVTIFTID